MNGRALTVGLALFLSACSAGDPGADRDRAEAAVARFVSALNDADVERLADTLSADATAYLPLPDRPALVEGKAALVEAFGEFFAGLRARGDGPPYMKLEPRELKVRLVGDVALATFQLSDLPGPAERPFSFSRRTLILRRLQGRWHVAHLHASNILLPLEETEAP